MHEAISIARYKALRRERAIDCSDNVFQAVSKSTGEDTVDCPACGTINIAGRFATVSAIYFFCSTCGHGWSVDQLTTGEHYPERRRSRAHSVGGDPAA